MYITKCFYNSNYDKGVLKSLIAKGKPKTIPTKVIVKSRQWGRVKKGPRGGENTDFVNKGLQGHGHPVANALNAKEHSIHTARYPVQESQNTERYESTKEATIICPFEKPQSKHCLLSPLTTKEVSWSGNALDTSKLTPDNKCGVNRDNSVAQNSDCVPLYDINRSSDKYVNTVIQRYSALKKIQSSQTCHLFNQWRIQSKYDFGFIPLSDFILPNNADVGNIISCPIEQHLHVKASGCSNFMHCRTPVVSQLNVDAWEASLVDYWDKQLMFLIRYGFPLDFNRDSPLYSDNRNHNSAVEFPNDVRAYLEEEREFGAILRPFKKCPIKNCHFSPFMTRHKPNSDNRRVIIDLSWPLENSVNDGIDKNSYLGTDFSLTFPSIDHITDEVRRIGKGAHLYKIDISRAFRHVKIDPGDYDLMGLYWQDAYLDTCLAFGTKHGSQIFQRLSNAVRHILRRHGYDVINYIDDFIGFGTPEVAEKSFQCLYQILQNLGLTISQKKLITPATRVVCLGVMIDTEKSTISVPTEKLSEIQTTVRDWLTKTSCTKRQLQSILGQLLYIHKCVRPARLFLNRMLQLLRDNYAERYITLTHEFKHDLLWFSKFLNNYNGVSIFDHKNFNQKLELDACLTGMGGVCGNYVYHLKIERGYGNLNIVHLEMLNILVALRIFGPQWAKQKLLIKCDNDAVVKVMNSGRTQDQFLGACARNIWFHSALLDIDIKYVHVLGSQNQTADLLSRWTGSIQDQNQLCNLVERPIWLEVLPQMLFVDFTM